MIKCYWCPKRAESRHEFAGKLINVCKQHFFKRGTVTHASQEEQKKTADAIGSMINVAENAGMIGGLD